MAQGQHACDHFLLYTQATAKGLIVLQMIFFVKGCIACSTDRFCVFVL